MSTTPSPAATAQNIAARIQGAVENGIPDDDFIRNERSEMGVDEVTYFRLGVQCDAAENHLEDYDEMARAVAASPEVAAANRAFNVKYGQPVLDSIEESDGTSHQIAR